MSTRRLWWFKRKLGCVVALMALLSCPSFGHAQVVGEKAKLNHVTLFDGSEFDPKSVEGNPTLVYFWASWCPRCRNEFRVLEQHYQSFRAQGFNIVAINFRDKVENAKALVAEVKPTFPVGIINDDWRSDYPKLFGTPTWFLLDKKGTIRKVVIGREIITGGWGDGLKAELQKVLEEK